MNDTLTLLSVHGVRPNHRITDGHGRKGRKEKRERMRAQQTERCVSHRETGIEAEGAREKKGNRKVRSERENGKK